MRRTETIKKLQEDTKLPLGTVAKAFKLDKSFELAKASLLRQKQYDLGTIVAELSVSFDDAEQLYIQYNCSVDRCLKEETKKLQPITLEEKKQSIELRLNRGELLVGKIQERNDDCYHWITVRKCAKNYELTLISLRKADVDACLDLIYSDAVELLGLESDSLEGMLALLQDYINIFDFDIRQAYESYPL